MSTPTPKPAPSPHESARDEYDPVTDTDLFLPSSDEDESDYDDYYDDFDATTPSLPNEEHQDSKPSEVTEGCSSVHQTSNDKKRAETARLAVQAICQKNGYDAEQMRAMHAHIMKDLLGQKHISELSRGESSRNTRVSDGLAGLNLDIAGLEEIDMDILLDTDDDDPNTSYSGYSPVDPSFSPTGSDDLGDEGSRGGIRLPFSPISKTIELDPPVRPPPVPVPTLSQPIFIKPLTETLSFSDRAGTPFSIPHPSPQPPIDPKIKFRGPLTKPSDRGLQQPRTLLTNADLSNAYFDTRLRHIEFGHWSSENSDDPPNPACLIVLDANFEIKSAVTNRRVRIRSAQLTLEFDDAPMDDDDYDDSRGPVIVGFAPQLLAVGPQSKATQVLTLALTTPADSTGSGLRLPGLKPDLRFTTRKETSTQSLIHGVAKGEPPRRCIWTVEEDPVARGGVPRVVRIAIITATPFISDMPSVEDLKRAGRRFQMRVAMTAKIRNSMGWTGQVEAGGWDDPVYFTPGVRAPLGATLAAEEVWGGHEKVEKSIGIKGGVVEVWVDEKRDDKEHWRTWTSREAGRMSQETLVERRESFQSNFTTGRDLRMVDLTKVTRRRERGPGQ